MFEVRLSIEFKSKDGSQVVSSSGHSLQVPALPPVGSTIFIEEFDDCDRRKLNLVVESIHMSSLPSSQTRFKTTHPVNLILVKCKEV